MRPVYGRSQVQCPVVDSVFSLLRACDLLITSLIMTIVVSCYYRTGLLSQICTSPFSPNMATYCFQIRTRHWMKWTTHTARYEITLSLTTDYALFTTGLFEVDVCSGSFNLLGNVFFFFFCIFEQKRCRLMINIYPKRSAGPTIPSSQIKPTFIVHQ